MWSRSSVLFAFAIGVAACGKRDGEARRDDGERAPPITSGATDAAPAAAPTPPVTAPALRRGVDDDIVLAADGLPPGALVRIGRPRWSLPLTVDSIAAGADGTVATCGGDRIRIWDGRAGLLADHKASRGAAIRCARSPDGALVVVGAGYGDSLDVTLLDWATGAAVWRAPARRHAGAAFSADGGQLLLLGEPTELQPTRATRATHAVDEPTIAGGFARDDTIVLVSAERVTRWSPATGAVTPIATVPGRVVAAAVTADAARVAWTTGDRVGTVDVATGVVDSHAVGAAWALRSLAISADGAVVAAGGKDAVAVWGADRWEVRYTIPRVYRAPVALSPDGATLWYGRGNEVVRADAATGAPDRPGEPARFGGWTADGMAMVFQDRARSWAIDPRTGAPATGAELPVEEPDDLPHWASWAGVGFAMPEMGCGPLRTWLPGRGARSLPAPRCDPDAIVGPWKVDAGVAVALDRGGPIVWDAIGGERIMTLPPQADEVVHVVVSQDRSVLLVESASRTGPSIAVSAWSLRTRRPLGELTSDGGGLGAIAISADGARAYLGWTDGRIEALDTATMQRRVLITHELGLSQLWLSPDGRLLAATDVDRSTTIWEL
jgi:hypothetical protein